VAEESSQEGILQASKERRGNKRKPKRKTAGKQKEMEI
jgi:hypothetical protein